MIGFIKLTSHRGRPLYLRVDQINSVIGAPLRADETQISTLNGVTYHVKETPKEIEAILRRAVHS
ncbi:flagellar FlbD family protein [Rhodococcus sp. 11-3]|uniref:flagellar FlbD family protein n=1 Tax=Rhodococcus sp. 11-3 TaxID=2854796 RepID=UPI00203BA3B5|nr:flagellar FlbD family protein [Rhodococcus sp. 11-3]USC16981.1 flagellar FlbD family protein [Rhodococcus sp. 11-3]